MGCQAARWLSSGRAHRGRASRRWLLLGHGHLGLGALYPKIGRREQAQAERTTVMALFRAMEMPFWLSEAEATLAQMEG